MSAAAAAAPAWACVHAAPSTERRRPGCWNAGQVLSLQCECPLVGAGTAALDLITIRPARPGVQGKIVQMHLNDGSVRTATPPVSMEAETMAAQEGRLQNVRRCRAREKTTRGSYVSTGLASTGTPRHPPGTRTGVCAQARAATPMAAAAPAQALPLPCSPRVAVRKAVMRSRWQQPGCDRCACCQVHVARAGCAAGKGQLESGPHECVKTQRLQPWQPAPCTLKRGFKRGSNVFRRCREVAISYRVNAGFETWQFYTVNFTYTQSNGACGACVH